jgi:O-antigen/teichoic acid export membrane protein
VSVRASAIYVAARGASGVLSLAALSMFARWLGPDGYAWFALASAGSATCVAVLLQPLQQSLARFLPGDQGSDLTATLARLMIAFIAVALVVAMAIEWLAAGTFPHGLALAAWALGSTQSIFDLAGKFASTRLMPTRFAAMYVVKAVLVLGSGLLLLQRVNEAAVAVAIVCVSSLLTSTVIGFPAWRDAVRGRFAREWLPRLRAFAVPLALTMLVTAVLQWADRFILAGHVTASDLGVYAAAVDLTQQSLGLLGSSLYLAWFPRLVAAHERADARERTLVEGHYASFVMAVLLPALTGFVLVRTDLVATFFGSAYVDQASAVMPWVALASVLGLLRTFVLDVGLFLSGRMRAQLRNVSVSALIGVALNLVFVARYGIWAAVGAALVAQSVALVMSWQSGRNVIRWRIPGVQLGRVLFCCGLMVLVLLMIPAGNTISLVIRMCAAAGVYGAAMVAVNGAGCRDWLASRIQRRFDRRTAP